MGEAAMPPAVHPAPKASSPASTPKRRCGLDALFSPRSIAVIGATDRVQSVGRSVMENLAVYPGPVFAINPNRTELFGKKVYPSVLALEAPPELVVIATPAITTPGIVHECAESGVQGCLILSAGFRECGAEGERLEREIISEAKRGSMRIIGPNCLGLMIPRLRLNATFASRIAQPGNVAFLSQSGALCTAILDWSLRENVGFSAFVSTGSMADVGWGDLIDYFGDDPHTQSIICYMESVTDAREFMSAAREVALTKPIIVLKVGRTESASKAAASHTGSLTGKDAVVDAAFRRAGVLRVSSLGELFDMAEVLAKQPKPRGPHLTIVTNAGGPGALATDTLVSSGAELTALSPSTIDSLNAFLPSHWSRGNPIDILGDASAERYRRSAEIAAADPNTNGLLAILTPQSMTNATSAARELMRLTVVGKPVLASWMGGAAVDEAKSMLNAAKIPTFDTPERAARAFALMWRYSENLRLLYEAPMLADAGPGKIGRTGATTVIQEARKCGRAFLTPPECERVLSAYGIPIVESHVALSEEDAVIEASRIGFPVAVKLYSETLSHKTDVNGVHLDLPNPDAVRRAWRAMQRSVEVLAGAGHFRGVIVQPMIRRDGFELILGSSIDPQFGPVILFGCGGTLLEVFNDTVLGFPPLNSTLAQRLIERTRIYTALKGIRGHEPIKMDSLVKILVNFSHLVAEQKWISEIDINPFIASPDRLIAVDVRMILHPLVTKEEELPRLAIQPYPSEYVCPFVLRNGASVMIRPIRPDDEPALARFHRGLSDQTVYMRYFGPLKLDQRIAHERLSRICFISYDREMALVAEARNEISGQCEIVAVGRLCRLRRQNESEFSILVGDEWQGHGLGTELLKTLVRVGRDQGLDRIVATILPENSQMQHIARGIGFKITEHQGECLAEIAVKNAVAAAIEPEI